MPKKDTFHETVKTALRKEGWNITNDPLFVPTEGGVNFFIDLGLEGIIGDFMLPCQTWDLKN